MGQKLYTNVPEDVVAALCDALNKDHPVNVRQRNGEPMVCANIPASIWNRIRDGMAEICETRAAADWPKSD